MGIFGWDPANGDPPARWDLRLAGWRMCAADCSSHIRLVDASRLRPEERRAAVEGDPVPATLLLLAIDGSEERAALLALGCGAALPSGTGLAELDIRARRVASLPGLLPRLREAGPVTLDLIHRDGRVGPRWLALHPREFALLWRLAETPGFPVTRPELLRDVWRLRHEPETNSVQVHVSRLRSKLAVHGLGTLVATDPAGGYRLAAG
jgi:DNA-binding response OmpR family regulator